MSTTAGLSWGGFNVFGDRASVDEVKRLQHLAGIVPYLQNELMRAREDQMDGLLMKYFVLRPAGTDDHARASREAMRKYAEEIEGSNPALAKELRAWSIKLALSATECESEP